MKKQFVIALCAGLILASCGSTTNKEAEDTHTGESEITAGETADDAEKKAEENGNETTEEDAVHFSAATAQILSDNYEELSALDGFDKEKVDDYIAQALTGDEASDIKSQTDLLNATEIMLGSDGYKAVDPAKHWRNRSGTADQHTSFSVGFNILLAAQSLGLDTDYALVWNMPHGSDEGSSTGTFIDWVNEISSQE